MNEKLQQAIASARNGQSTEAQLLLTQILQDDPNEIQAWFLLSNLVESEQKKAAYLSKVLALNPNHEMAKQMLARLQKREKGAADEVAVMERETAVPPEPPRFRQTESEPQLSPATPPESSEDAVRTEDDKTPAWLATDELQWGQPDFVQASNEPQQLPEVPDWLLDQESNLAEEETTVAPSPSPSTQQPEIKPVKASSKPPATTDEDRRKQQAALTRILYVLVTAATILLLIMLYLIGTAL